MTALIDTFNRLVTGVFDLLLRPLHPRGAAFALAVAAILAAALALWVYLRLSDQAGIRGAKSLIDADVIALSLYRRAPGVLPRILGSLVLGNLTYLRLSLKPLLILCLPFLIIFVQLQGRYAFRPLQVGEAALVAVTVADGGLLRHPGAIALEGGAGVTVETPPVRIPALRKAVWRVRAAREGSHSLTLTAGGKRLGKQVVVGATPALLSPSRTADRLGGGLLHPGEPILDPGAGVRTVTVAYPELRVRVIGLDLHWLVWFLLVLAVAAWIMKSVRRVSF